MKVLLITGTRPEAIKMVPVYRALATRDDMSTCLVLTGQHRDIARGVLDLFGVCADIDLDLLEPSQTLISLSSRTTAGLARVIEEESPDAMLVQGDTTSAVIGGLLDFYAVGTDRSQILTKCQNLLLNPKLHETIAKTVNPHGQGRASQMIAQVLGKQA